VASRWVLVLFWAYLFVLVGAEGIVANPADPDLWHRLALGEALWQTGHFPLGDAFSYLADYQHIADHEWGSALVFYGLYQLGGGTAMVMAKLVAMAATLALLVGAGLQGRRPTVLLAAFYALVLLALLPSFQSTIRCMLFTNFFFALWLYWFQCERHGRGIPLWAYLLTMVIWANLHGGFALGLAWLFCATLAQIANGNPWRSWAIRFVGCGAVTLVNPFGWQLWLSTGRALVTTRKGFGEWAPVSWWPDVMGFPGYKLMVFGVVMAAVICLWRGQGKRLNRVSLFLIGAALALSLTSARHTSLFASVVGALLPDLLPREPSTDEMPQTYQRLGWIALRLSLLLIPLYAALMILPGEGLRLSYPAVSTPVKAVAYLQQQNIRGRLLVPFNYGSYALWELRGRMRVSMDGRYDLVYRPETYRKVDDFFFARGDWTPLLSEPAPDAILLPIVDPVYAKLKARPGWKEAYHDAVDAVFLPTTKLGSAVKSLSTERLFSSTVPAP
jgi:hypothetical protein